MIRFHPESVRSPTRGSDDVAKESSRVGEHLTGRAKASLQLLLLSAKKGQRQEEDSGLDPFEV